MDVPMERFADLLNEWRKRSQEAKAGKEMDEFIAQSCPKWAKYVLKDKDHPRLRA